MTGGGGGQESFKPLSFYRPDHLVESISSSEVLSSPNCPNKEDQTLLHEKNWKYRVNQPSSSIHQATNIRCDDKMEKQSIDYNAVSQGRMVHEFRETTMHDCFVSNQLVHSTHIIPSDIQRHFKWDYKSHSNASRQEKSEDYLTT